MLTYLPKDNLVPQMCAIQHKNSITHIVVKRSRVHQPIVKGAGTVFHFEVVIIMENYTTDFSCLYCCIML